MNGDGDMMMMRRGDDHDHRRGDDRRGDRNEHIGDGHIIRRVERSFGSALGSKCRLIVMGLVAALIAIFVFSAFMFRATNSLMSSLGATSWRTATDAGNTPTTFGYVLHAVVMILIVVGIGSLPADVQPANMICGM